MPSKAARLKRRAVETVRTAKPGRLLESDRPRKRGYKVVAVSLYTDQAESIEQTAHDAWSSTDAVFPQAWGNLLGGQIRPHHVLAHGGTCDAVLDRVVHLLE